MCLHKLEETFETKICYLITEDTFVKEKYVKRDYVLDVLNKPVDVVKEWNVDKLYICAGSAEETIAFYFAIGCKEAVEVNKELYESDSRDFQLEYEI